MTAFITIVIALVVVALAIAAARDMDRRGHKGEVYALAVLFVLPIGLVLWAHDRGRPPR
jgi:hypothetical protein